MSASPADAWLANPLASPLFWPVVKVVGGILGFVLAALLLKERRHWRELHRRELFKRLVTWAVIAPVYGVAVLGGRAPVVVLVSAMVFQGLREYASLVGLPRTYRWVLLGLGLLAAPAALVSELAFYSLPALLLVLATLQPLLLQDTTRSVRDLAFATFGWGYLAWLLGHFMLLYLYVDQGPAVLLALSVALSDVGAFLFGKTFGRRKLAPRLSPGKTWAGVAGNFVGAYGGMAAMYLALPLNVPAYLAFSAPAVIAIGSLWGDLLESAMKREFGVKDAGAWLPGFGGLLDRIDSLVVVVPLMYYLFKFIGAA